MGPTGEMMLTYRATNALLTESGCGAVLPFLDVHKIISRCYQDVSRCSMMFSDVFEMSAGVSYS